MMTFLVGLLTVVLVLNSLFLILLVLVQLPKKEAGVGMAFGGGATETLFGAGSGTVLTRATKYSAGIFMGLSLVLAIVNAHLHQRSEKAVAEELRRLGSENPVMTAPGLSNAPTPALPTPAAPGTSTAATPELLLSNTNLLLESTPVAPAPAPSEPATEPPVAADPQQ